MDADSQFVGGLSGSQDLKSLVGDRIYRQILKQGTAYPALTYTKLTGAPDYALDGPTGDVQASFSVTVWARTPEEAREVAPVVRAAAEATGYMQTDDSDSPYDDKAKVFGVVLTFEAWTEE